MVPLLGERANDEHESPASLAQGESDAADLDQPYARLRSRADDPAPAYPQQGRNAPCILDQVRARTTDPVQLAFLDGVDELHRERHK